MRHLQRRGGFTLIELLVVIVIVLAVSAAALPVVLPALADRKLESGARIVQAQFTAARDMAAGGKASGVRLEPDPAFPPVRLTGGTLDPDQPLTYTRLVPLVAAGEYTEGLVSAFPVAPPSGWTKPYPALVVCECPFDSNGGVASPTSWAWNLRVGEKMTVGGAIYTIAGPMVVGPTGGNAERFVNYGNPGAATGFPWLERGASDPPAATAVEYLYLVNGEDDDGDGWVDEGFDGMDQDLDGLIDEAVGLNDEWEIETWRAVIKQQALALPPIPSSTPPRVPRIDFLPYSVARRPAPASAGVVQLPGGVVIDASDWAGGRNRSRLPVDPVSGSVDLIFDPEGAVNPVTVYSTSSQSQPYGAAWLHFWLGDAGDVAMPLKPNVVGRLVSLNMRTGRLLSSDADSVDPAAARKLTEQGR